VKHAPALLVTLFFILPLCAQKTSIQDSLWQKAVTLSGANEDWVPGLLVVRMEMLDGRGSTQNTEETWLKMSLGPDGKIKKDLIKQVKDGKVKDGPETKVEARSGDGKKKGEKKGTSISVSSSDNPFSPKVQGNVSAKRTAQLKTILGKPCAGYEFKLSTKEGETVSGTAWLEDPTGIPLEIQYSVRPLPAHVQRLSTLVRYETTPEGAWRPREMVMEGSGGFLFIKKAYRGVIRFSDYWKCPPSAKE
jgi:hypothetical protein